MKTIECFIERSTPVKDDSKIPKNFIQTYKNNNLHECIYNNVMQILELNTDFNYYLITDDIGIELIKKYFDNNTLDAFNKLNLGAAKGDFLRYIAMYVYGGVYLDLDSSIKINLSSFIDDNIEYLFFLDWDDNIQQWCFMCAAKNPIMLNIIKEMVKRINNKEENIFLVTGPTLFTDVLYNTISNSNVYNTKLHISNNDRRHFFMSNKNFMNGLILYENDKTLHFRDKFIQVINNYNESMLYNNDKYIVTYNRPTPFFYK